MSNERHEAIGRAIERAAQVLPDGCELEISVEKGSASVRLYLPDTDAYLDDFGDEPFHLQIDAAIDAALAESEGRDHV